MPTPLPKKTIRKEIQLINSRWWIVRLFKLSPLGGPVGAESASEREKLKGKKKRENENLRLSEKDVGEREIDKNIYMYLDRERERESNTAGRHHHDHVSNQRLRQASSSTRTPPQSSSIRTYRTTRDSVNSDKLWQQQFRHRTQTSTLTRRKQ